MNRVVKLASSIGILVMLIAVGGGVPTAIAQQAPWRTVVVLSCPASDADGRTGVLLYHDGVAIGYSGELRCTPFGVTTSFIVTPSSAGVPNGFRSGVSVLGIFGQTVKVCNFFYLTSPPFGHDLQCIRSRINFVILKVYYPTH